MARIRVRAIGGLRCNEDARPCAEVLGRRDTPGVPWLVKSQRRPHPASREASSGGAFRPLRELALAGVKGAFVGATARVPLRPGEHHGE